MPGKRGSWLVATVLLPLLCGLAALGLHAWRERGAWLRTEPGKFRLCVEVLGGEVSEDDLVGLDATLTLIRDAGIPSRPEKAGVQWQGTRAAPSTLFRPGFVQYTFIRIDPETNGALEDPDGFLRDFRGCLPRPEKQVAGYRLALVDDRGEVVRIIRVP